MEGNGAHISIYYINSYQLVQEFFHDQQFWKHQQNHHLPKHLGRGTWMTEKLRFPEEILADESQPKKHTFIISYVTKKHTYIKTNNKENPGSPRRKTQMVVSQTFQGVATIFSLSYIILNKINCENLCSLTKEPELLGIIPKLLPLTISSITIMILMLLNRPDTSRLRRALSQLGTVAYGNQGPINP